CVTRKALVPMRSCLCLPCPSAAACIRAWAGWRSGRSRARTDCDDPGQPMTGRPDKLAPVEDEAAENYRLQEQIGFVLRKAHQRHVAIFAARIADLTPPQFAALTKLDDVGETSQNQLGSLIAMDAATV